MDAFEEAVDEYHVGLREFVRGNGDRVMDVYSRESDVVLCSPLRPFAEGPEQVASELREAASHFSEGTCDFERVQTVATPALAFILEVERFTGKLDGNAASVALRVTTVFRPEETGWKIVHRHANPITSRPAGELGQA